MWVSINSKEAIKLHNKLAFMYFLFVLLSIIFNAITVLSSQVIWAWLSMIFILLSILCYILVDKLKVRLLDGVNNNYKKVMRSWYDQKRNTISNKEHERR